MPDKRMRPIVKQEPGADGAQELQQQQHAAAAAAAAAAGERDGRRRRGDMGEEGAGTELEVQLLRANAEAQAFALQGMERERAMAEELLQAKAQFAELRADIRIKDAALVAKGVASSLAGSTLMLRVGDMLKVKQFNKLMRTRLAGKRYRLLYTWSSDGRSNASFHRLCDNQVRLRTALVFVLHEICTS
jgi:hypothetical protein